MIREVDYNPNKKLVAGIDKLNDAVASTMGPLGSYVMYDTTLGPKTTKDGVTVVSRFALEDLTENMGAHMLKLASAKVADSAGDGSSSVVVMATELIKEGFKTNIAPIILKRELEEEKDSILNLLETLSNPIEGDSDLISDIATLAANNDRVLGNLVAESYKLSGKYGLIRVEDGKSSKSTIENKEGYSFKRSFLSPYFVTNPRDLSTEYEDVYVCLYNNKIRYKDDIIPLLEIASKSQKPVLLICESLEGEALTLTLANLAAQRIKFVAVEAPGYGIRRKELLEDIALITEGTNMDNDLALSLKDIKESHLGVAKKIIVDKVSTTILINKSEELASKIEEKIQTLKSQLANKDLNSYEREKITERMAKLASKLVVIKVGGANEVEVNEIRDRLDDSIRAVRSALEEGIVPGCGKTYWLLSMHTTSNVLKKGLRSIIKTVLENANTDYETVVNYRDFGNTQNTYDAINKVVGNYIELGIIDPTKVVREVIINAVSVAIQVLMTKVVIQEDKDKLHDNNLDLE